MDITRRFLLFGAAALGLTAASEALAARRRAPARRRTSRRKRPAKAADKPAAAPAPPKKPAGQPLAIPELIRVGDGETFELAAGPARASFVADKPVDVAGYNGRYLGPAVKIARGTTPRLRLTNGLDRPTNLHWHGLLVPSQVDGGAQGIAPGASWEAALPVDQPAATLWYHAHVHGRVAADIHDGLAGLLIVEDEASARLGLPSDWGVDDIPLIVQDRNFDEDGRPVYQRTPELADHGFRGTKVMVNGTLDAVATVPQRLVRLRILNASSARVYRFFFSDERPFKLIATDGGFLPAPADADTVSVAPGERVEILVDFADGGSTLMSTPDDHDHRVGTRTVRMLDVVSAPFRICAFHTEKDGRPSARVPARLADLGEPDPAPAVKRRRFVLQLGGAVALSASAAHDGHGEDQEFPVMAINGKSFDPARIDEEVALGTTEIWDIVTPEMAHSFHIHGVQFRVLSEDGGIAKIWNRGVKDTVLVENSTSLLVTFTRPAAREAPFLYHCHTLEHEDSGMMGTFTVG